MISEGLSKHFFSANERMRKAALGEFVNVCQTELMNAAALPADDEGRRFYLERDEISSLSPADERPEPYLTILTLHHKTAAEWNEMLARKDRAEGIGDQPDRISLMFSGSGVSVRRHDLPRTSGEVLADPVKPEDAASLRDEIHAFIRNQRPDMDESAVRNAVPMGRILPQECSLASWGVDRGLLFMCP